MSSARQMTEEEMKYLSVIATHTALIELGKLEESKTSTEKQQEKDNIEMIQFLKKYLTLIEYFEKSKNPDTTNMAFGNPETVKEIIDKSLQHINKLNTIIQSDKLEYNKLQKENKELQEEHRELIEETEKLEHTIETKEQSNMTRIEKLRNICIKRNKTIKILKKLLIIMAIHLIVISYIGFVQYYYSFVCIAIGLSNIIYNIYNSIRFSGENLLYFINIIKYTFIQILPFIYSVWNISYGFYIVYYLLCVSIYKDMVNSFYAGHESYTNNMFNYSNSSISMCYI